MGNYGLGLQLRFWDVICSSLNPLQGRIDYITEMWKNYIVLRVIGNLLFLFIFLICFLIKFSGSPTTSAIYSIFISDLYIAKASSSFFCLIIFLFMGFGVILASIEYLRPSSPLWLWWVSCHRTCRTLLPQPVNYSKLSRYRWDFRHRYNPSLSRKVQDRIAPYIRLSSE